MAVHRKMETPPSSDDAAAVSTDDDPTAVEVAYQRGQKDKAQGMSRQAMPGEYRRAEENA